MKVNQRLGLYGLGVVLLGLLLVGPVAYILADDSGAPAESVYTCSMHPHVRLPNPGSCPICSMPLVPTGSPAGPSGGEGKPEQAIRLSAHERAMTSVESSPVERRKISYQVKAVGKVAYNETALATITTRVDGYAERLYVNFTGIEVKKGDHLADVYSPDLVVAQQELIVASSSGGSDMLLESAKLKLQRWGLTDQQIKDLKEKGKITERITLLSPISGTVISRNITQNAAFKAGDALYQIANLDSVWVYLEIYESQLPWLRYGQHVTFTTEAQPGRKFDGMVSFISPLVEEDTRTIRVPVHVENADHALKPGMFMSAIIHATLNSAGTAGPTGVEGKFTCPMHPQVVEAGAGSCPICGMDLKKVPGSAEHSEALLAIPISAVLDWGTRKLVYVEKEPGLFEGRDIVVGPKAGDVYPVLRGLSEGEKVAIRGNFLLDSQAQISGMPSLFYPSGAAGSMLHQHGGGDTKAGSAPPASSMRGHRH